MNRQAIALATALLVTTPAFAADLGWNGGNTGGSLYSPTSVSDWTGFYAGINGGYGWGEVTRKPVGGGITTENNSGGWTQGAQAGYTGEKFVYVIGG